MVADLFCTLTHLAEMELLLFGMTARITAFCLSESEVLIPRVQIHDLHYI
jgi:hypothetical protein